jgi:DNA polymerase-3 subunit alpha
MRVHSCFSLGYGILKPEALVEWAQQQQYSALLLTDINHTGSALAFVRAAQQHGIKAVLGLELRKGQQHIATLVAGPDMQIGVGPQGHRGAALGTGPC